MVRKMTEPTIKCPLFLAEEKKIKRITDRINEAETFGEKAKQAQELLDEVDVLLQCENYDKKNFDCVNCRRISNIRRETANLFVKPKEAGKKIAEEFGEFKGGIGGIFKGLGSLISLASKLAEEQGEVRHGGEIKGLGKGARGVYGFTVKSGIGKRRAPIIERFGNIREEEEGPVIEESREPIIDVFDEKDYVEVIAEIPGVNEDDIKADVKGDILIIGAESGDRKYSKEVLLPKEADTKRIKSTYKSGILKIRLEKKVKKKAKKQAKKKVEKKAKKKVEKKAKKAKKRKKK